MIELSPDRIASAAGAEVVRSGGGGRPERAVIDSREVGPGDLFFGLSGERSEGGEFAGAALEAGAWGVVVAPEWAHALAPGRDEATGHEGGWVLAARILSPASRAWRAPGAASSHVRSWGSPDRWGRPP